MSKAEVPVNMIVYSPNQPVGRPRHHLYLYPLGEKDPELVCIRFDDAALFKGIASKTWKQQPDAFVEMQDLMLQGLAIEFDNHRQQMVKEEFQDTPAFHDFLVSAGCLLEMSAVRGGGKCESGEGHHVMVGVEPSNQKQIAPLISIKSAIIDTDEPLDLMSLYLWMRSEFEDGSQTKRLEIDKFATMENTRSPSANETMLVVSTGNETEQRHHLYIYPADYHDDCPVVCLRFDDHILNGQTGRLSADMPETLREIFCSAIIEDLTECRQKLKPLMMSGVGFESSDIFKEFIAAAQALMQVAILDKPLQSLRHDGHHVLLGITGWLDDDVILHEVFDYVEPLALDVLNAWFIEAADEEAWLLDEDEHDNKEEEEDVFGNHAIFIDQINTAQAVIERTCLYVVDSVANKPVFEIPLAALTDAAEKNKTPMALANAITSINALAELWAQEPSMRATLKNDAHFALITLLRWANSHQHKPSLTRGAGKNVHLVFDLGHLKSEDSFHAAPWLSYILNTKKLSLNSVMKQVRESNQ